MVYDLAARRQIKELKRELEHERALKVHFIKAWKKAENAEVAALLEIERLTGRKVV